MKSNSKVLLLSAVLAVLYWVHHLRSTTRNKHFRSPDVTESTSSQMMRYLNWSNRSSCRSVEPLDRFSRDDEITFGRVVCADPGLKLQPPRCLVYWFGHECQPSSIGPFERLGCQVYGFCLWTEGNGTQRSKRVHLEAVGLGHRDTDDDPIDGFQRRTLLSFYKRYRAEHGDVAIDLVRMEVKQSDWLVIPQMVQSAMLGRVKQLSLRIHFHENVPFKKYLQTCLAILTSVEETGGMVRFASGPVPEAEKGLLLGEVHPLTYELSWFNPRFNQEYSRL